MPVKEKRNALVIKLGVRDSIEIRLNQDFMLIDEKKGRTERANYSYLLSSE